MIFWNLCTNWIMEKYKTKKKIPFLLTYFQFYHTIWIISIRFLGNYAHMILHQYELFKWNIFHMNSNAFAMEIEICLFFIYGSTNWDFKTIKIQLQDRKHDKENLDIFQMVMLWF